MKHFMLFSKKLMWVLALLCCFSTSVAAQEMISLIDDPVHTLKAPMLKANRSMMLGLPGDLNGDCAIDVADVTALINMVLNSSYAYTGDLDNDGSADVADVTNLINRILNSSNPSVDDVQRSLDVVYRSMRTYGWSTLGNTHQTFGILANSLFAEVMGDDMIMGAQGSGWFWYEAAYNSKKRYTSTAWTSYHLWTTYYTWIANANYLLRATQRATGAEFNYVKGQAYALRAYSYFMLAQWFARTYKGHETDPCVPLFEGIAFDESTGQPRATVAQVYSQIDADITQAINLLNGTTQQSPAHIGYAVAQGMQARIALVKEEWNKAYSSAVKAINASGKSIQNVSDFMGVNDATAGNVMWGAEIPVEEVGMYASFFAHMSITKDAYGTRAPKQISTWLYDKMSATDARRAWWDPTSSYSTGGYAQLKFDFSNADTWEGDYIYMRVEEMYLTIAEAACRLSLYSTATNNLKTLMSKRDPNYTCTKTGSSLGSLTTDETGSLLEEILIQRRLELWGEDNRILTIRRLHQGFERSTDYGWPAQLSSGHAWNDPECYAWVMTIPQSEFDGNPNMDPIADQNPLGDYSAVGMHISLGEREYSTTTARTAMSIPITVTRAITRGAYTANLRVSASGDTATVSTADFSDGSGSTTATLNIGGLQLGNEYTYIVSLSDADQASYNPSQGEQITSMTIKVQCVNGDPSVQHVSFETGSLSHETEYTGMSIPVSITRATTQGDYRTTIAMEDNDANVHLDSSTDVFFADGSSTATVWVYFNSMERGQTSSCVLRITDAQGAAGGQHSSITISVTRVETEQAGNVTFTDYTFDRDGASSTNVAVYRIKGTDEYYLYEPFYNLYAVDGNWHFTLNSDGSIAPVEGDWGVNISGYRYLYDSANYPSYCHVEQNGNTYTVHFLVEGKGGLYIGGPMEIVWER